MYCRRLRQGHPADHRLANPRTHQSGLGRSGQHQSAGRHRRKHRWRQVEAELRSQRAQGRQRPQQRQHAHPEVSELGAGYHTCAPASRKPTPGFTISIWLANAAKQASCVSPRPRPWAAKPSFRPHRSIYRKLGGTNSVRPFRSSRRVARPARLHGSCYLRRITLSFDAVATGDWQIIKLSGRGAKDAHCSHWLRLRRTGIRGLLRGDRPQRRIRR